MKNWPTGRSDQRWKICACFTRPGMARTSNRAVESEAVGEAECDIMDGLMVLVLGVGGSVSLAENFRSRIIARRDVGRLDADQSERSILDPGYAINLPDRGNSGEPLIGLRRDSFMRCINASD